MKTRLSYKIFTAFLVMSCMLVALMVGSFQYLMESKFSDFVNQTILNRMDKFVAVVIAEYQGRRGWQALTGDNERWWEMVAASHLEDDPEHPSRRAFPPKNRPFNETPSASQTTKTPDGAPPLPYRLVRSLVLFDDQRRIVVGGDAEDEISRYTLRPLSLDGKTIGWIGLHKKGRFSDPLVLAYLKEQALVFYYIGGMILSLAAVISFLLSRHLLAPIRRLTQGTRDLAAFRFNTRIQVRSQDELGQLARDFNRMAETLNKYEVLRRQWISDISHELRTPLSILKGEIEALQDGVRPFNPDTLASLHAEVLRLSKLVADLHDLSLADSQNLLSTRKKVRPLEILRHTVEHYSRRMARHHIDLQTDVSDDDAVTFQGDPDRLVQLFTNVMENTLRYTDAPGVLKIGECHDARQLTIWFEDSSPGVPDHALWRIFERLYRVESSRNRNLGGSGLGLAICKQIVEAHGGTMAASHAALGGLRIDIVLPLHRTDDELH